MTQNGSSIWRSSAYIVNSGKVQTSKAVAGGVGKRNLTKPDTTVAPWRRACRSNGLV